MICTTSSCGNGRYGPDFVIKYSSCASRFTPSVSTKVTFALILIAWFCCITRAFT
eukprot:TRINITY_DN76208_c0_g1_i1.p3 TRINITY_DN76208_c0_g1~~TRINITY_DN76208_c0_g1_i1.p3  ORF type:complete len:55 (+),score=11.19 TRINITY_DN76208_c0_g1_i1:278-442(+)